MVLRLLGAGAGVSRASGWRSFATASAHLEQFISDGTVSRLSNPRNGAQVFLIGTAHVSSKSAEEVKEVIDAVRPNVVAVELCEDRARKLMSGTGEPVGLIHRIQEFMRFPGGLSQKLLHFAIRSFYQALREAGLEPGKEFRVAMEEAKVVGASIILIDQDANTTISRLTKAISLRDVLRMMRTRSSEMEECMKLVEELGQDNLSEAIEKLKRRDAVRKLMKFMDNNFPNLVRAILHERDEIMTQKLLQIQGEAVAVVGMAHMDGIERRWKQIQQ